ncbi:23S rRNA (cytidine1920-2'-O)/16S rRNA (cytidine1409-2'-O)-methyltransferase [Chromohalobacter marismortui]|uniref:23S rRNA (Cytidine1920-2'-O)/16S rRNA (Cytidine1409-2'-O)-methyltransferase n=1 Tax=Chromohalobacter marismortui TaxID=42055 RepID=A0A4R7NVW0_9GAMM|nr:MULTISPECIES: TlyA family RNA methyltransferase [Chromohalobacter]MCI0510535.1 TlyA family RNA methyltransferase [Chromohalobacter sp.]MCI0594112.1 TlyA family RNA methyltransferase [Chromohalobacter sp.]TDU24889.1 23S rRNA (cytidine1920-2'-O)/16S rRNA (cytidine1409-2'-O)-methyltransferase [Chromohalobacter marismortui]
MPRLDQLLVAQGWARSRTRAQRLIRHGRVTLVSSEPSRVLTKPSETLPSTSRFTVTEDPEARYVSRAGLKLEGVLETLAMRFDGMTVLDVGQSTGGFTECALRFGAARVLGIEVGRDQLAPVLREEPRVICLEGINARALPRERLAALAPEGLHVAVMDVSFISQTLILPELAAVLAPGGQLISLVKPQFEVGPGKVDAHGIVRDSALFADVEARIRDSCADAGFAIRHWQESPLRGGDGNREFLLHAVNSGP